MPGHRPLIVVANRLPVQRPRTGEPLRWTLSPGGLVTALGPILQKHGGTWIGWPGHSGPAPRAFSHDGIRIQPVELSASEVDGYYHGFSNESLWPLYHDCIRTPKFETAWWKPYVDVNWRYAQAAARQAKKGNVVWVHDYQLQLVPRMIRELSPGAPIGFFLHIPFPPDELFAWLPWRREILEGLLGADVIGFQTPADARNFARAARNFTDAEGKDTLLRFRGRDIRVGAFAISIDTPWFEKAAQLREVQRHAKEIRERIGPTRKIILGVDRIDYTKGIEFRMAAFEELLRREIADVENCVMMQIAVPSREDLPDYAETRRRIERIVGRINGEYSEPGRVAVHYFRRQLSREDLAAYYLASDVMAVTPLRDGMNLVAKEYVATRADNTGVLMLSEFAGAASELRQALFVNPRDLDGMVRGFDTALHLSRRDARLRMSVLRTQVRRHTVFNWANDFLEAFPR